MTDTTKVNQYQDQVVEAVGTIVRKAVESISFDKTIVCTIKDDSKKEDGEYIVSDGSSTFSAYTSDTSLYKNNKVYVTIPEGNYDNQKIIIGKKSDEKYSVYTYKEPFDRIIDLTENLIEENKEVALVSNKDANEEKGPIQIQKIAEKNFGETVYTGFNYIGLKADFRSLMNNAVSGEYGLEVKMQIKKYLTEQEIKENEKKIKELQTTGNLENSEEVERLEKENTQGFKNIEYIFKLSSDKDMFGNPYSFNIYQEQQAVFPINKEDILVSYTLSFYENGNFKDINDKLINQGGASAVDGTNAEKEEGVTTGIENLFVKNIYLCAGIEAENVGSEYLNLYTFDAPTYSKDNETKTVNFRWLRKDDNGLLKDVVPQIGNEVSLFAVRDIAEPQEENKESDKLDKYEIRWYRYVLGAPAADQFCGVYWVRQSPEDIRKLIFTPSLNYQSEKIKVIIVEKDTQTVLSRSDIMVFENEIRSDMYNSVEGLENMSFSFGDGMNGDYFIYNQGRELIDKSQENKERTITIYETLDESISQLQDYTEITWKLPYKNTMLKFPSYSTIINDEYIEVKNETSIDYKISGFYNPNATNNTITCIIRKNENTYLINKKIDFGFFGTNGSDYTLYIECEQDAIVWESGKSAAYTVRLYDINGKELGNDSDFTWSWYSENGKGLTLDSTTGKTITVKVGANDATGLYILQVKYNNLIAYKPIALSSAGNLEYTGPREIIYPTTGELEYYNAECKLSGGNGNNSPKLCVWNSKDKKLEFPEDILSEQRKEIERLQAIIKNPQSSSSQKEQAEKDKNNVEKNKKENEGRLATIGSMHGNIFKPTPFYIKSDLIYGICFEGKWIQPILVLQNKYPSTVVDQWDGVTPTINTEEGYILTPVIAAGKKNDDNTFSGVMIGDMGKLKTGSELSRQTGIYGFHQGAVSYAFKEDGTAFIGKSGKGRIHFNGDKSTITSSGYETGTGIKIDLDDPYIHIRNDVTSSHTNGVPFQVNNVTKIDWNGTLTSSQVNLTGGVLQSGPLYINFSSDEEGIIFGAEERLGALKIVPIITTSASNQKLANIQLRFNSGQGLPAHGVIGSYEETLSIGLNNGCNIVFGLSDRENNYIDVQNGVMQGVSGGVIYANFA